MSTKKNKVVFSFRLDEDLFDKISELVKKDPLSFRSAAPIGAAAIHHFLSLPKTEQREIIKKYLTKDL